MATSRRRGSTVIAPAASEVAGAFVGFVPAPGVSRRSGLLCSASTVSGEGAQVDESFFRFQKYSTQ